MTEIFQWTPPAGAVLAARPERYLADQFVLPDVLSGPKIRRAFPEGSLRLAAFERAMVLRPGDAALRLAAAAERAREGLYDVSTAQVETGLLKPLDKEKAEIGALEFAKQWDEVYRRATAAITTFEGSYILYTRALWDSRLLAGLHVDPLGAFSLYEEYQHHMARNGRHTVPSGEVQIVLLGMLAQVDLPAACALLTHWLHQVADGYDGIIIENPLFREMVRRLRKAGL